MSLSPFLAKLAPWRWWAIGLLIALVLSHPVVMAIDWRLRPPGNARLGGLSEEFMSYFQVVTFVVFAVASFVACPGSWRVWKRGLLGVGAGLVAFVAMAAGWWMYIIGNAGDPPPPPGRSSDRRAFRWLAPTG